MVIQLKKIWHRDAFRIAAFFRYDTELIAKFKAIGATYSKTHKCWYLSYTSTSKRSHINLAKDLNLSLDYSESKKQKAASDLKASDLPYKHQKVFDRYRLYLQRQRKSKSTVSTYSNFVRFFLKFNEHKRLKNLDHRCVERFAEQVLAKRNYSISSHRQAMNALKHFFILNSESNVLVKSIQMPKKDRKLPTVLSSEEVLSILQVTRNLKHRCLLALLYSCGLRVG